ncbi:unnamed protein product, partial [Tetraodon nigroviridis]
IETRVTRNWGVIGGIAAAIAAGVLCLFGAQLQKKGRKKKGMVPGLLNLGNTFFLNSFLQGLAACPSFICWREKILDSPVNQMCTRQPAVQYSVTASKRMHMNSFMSLRLLWRRSESVYLKSLTFLICRLWSTSSSHTKSMEVSASLSWSFNEQHAVQALWTPASSVSLHPFTKTDMVQRRNPEKTGARAVLRVSVDGQLQTQRFHREEDQTCSESHSDRKLRWFCRKANYHHCPSQYLFQLTAVLVHHGDMHSGHFVTYRRSPSPPHLAFSSQWLWVSDDSVRKASLQEVLSSNAYMLFYERVQ